MEIYLCYLSVCECLFSVLLRTEHLESSYQARLADRMLITDRRVLFAVHNGEKYLMCLEWQVVVLLIKASCNTGKRLN